MKVKTIRKIREKLEHPERKFLPDIFAQFFQNQAIGGVLLVACTIIAIIAANTPALHALHNCWNTIFTIGFPHFKIEQPLLLWVNDGLMAIFFFVVGLEIKREMLAGELASRKQAALPAFAAVGGMLIPAFIYFIFNHQGPASNGWGIPMATDIAFSIGILSLMGKRVPLSFKVFLTALAIVDDLGAIVVLAVFYPAHAIHVEFFVWIALVCAALFTLNRLRINHPIPYIILGIVLWILMLHSGIHATIAGVLLAAAIPSKTSINEARFYFRSKLLLNRFRRTYIEEGIQMLASKKKLSLIHSLDQNISRINPLMHRFEAALHPVVIFIIMPVFALANAGIRLNSHIVPDLFSNLSLGIFFGLLIGKPLGITLFCWIATKLKWAIVPENTQWRHIFSLGMIAGVGFTMSIFINGLAFEHTDMIELGKISVLITSFMAGICGWIALTVSTSTKKNELITYNNH